MNKKTGYYLILNDIRLTKGTLRHYWPALLGLVAAVAVVFYEISQELFLYKIGAPLPDRSRWYMVFAVCLLAMFPVVFPATFSPALRIRSATVLYTYNTPLLKRILLARTVILRGRQVVMAILIALFTYGLQPGHDCWMLSVSLFFFLANMASLSWIAFHGRKLDHICACISACALFVVMIYGYQYSHVVGLSFFIWSILYFRSSKFKINLPKYFERVRKMDEADGAGSQYDLVRMQQLAAENRSSTVKGVTFEQLRPSLKTAIFAKALLDVVRLQTNLLIFFILLTGAGWIMLRTSLFSFIPFLDNQMARVAVGTFCIALVLNALYQFLLSQAKEMCEKRTRGLPLPHSKRSIYQSYCFVAVLLNLIYALLFCVFFGSSAVQGLFFFVLSGCSFVVMVLMTESQLFLQRALRPVVTVLLFAAVFCGVCTIA